MRRRPLATGLYVLGFFFLALAAALADPADMVVFLLGFVAGSLTFVQLSVLGFGTLATAAAFWLDRRAASPRRAPAAVFAAAALAIIVHVGWRDFARYSRETVVVTAGPNQLEATLYVPRGATTRRPALLLLHGSGPMSRGAYHFLADRLAREGRIVLNVDKRGVGRSTGKYYGDDTGRRTPLEHRADDAAASLALLRSDARVDTTAIGVFGISQGGWVFPLLAKRDSSIRFAVMYSGPSVSTGEEETFSELSDELGDHFGRRPPPLSFEELDRRMRATPASGYDPRADLAHVSIPTLWLYGDWDSSLPVEASVRVLDTLQRTGSPFTVRRFPEANHGLFIARGPNARRLSRFAPGVWDTVATWLAAHCAVQPTATRADAR